MGLQRGSVKGVRKQHVHNCQELTLVTASARCEKGRGASTIVFHEAPSFWVCIPRPKTGLEKKRKVQPDVQPHVILGMQEKKLRKNDENSHDFGLRNTSSFRRKIGRKRYLYRSA